jgi:ribose transport system ATP-binding protein
VTGVLPPRVAVRGLTKTFGATLALADVDMSVAGGSVHGLLGQNGCGKSTLIKVLAGYHALDRGTVLIDGEPLRGGSDRPSTALAFVHQDLALVDELSVLENLYVGRHVSRAGLVDVGAERRAATSLLERFDIQCSPADTVSSLSEVERALLAIARAVAGIEGSGRAGLLVLDEPTVYLPRDGVERLFATIRTVAASGTSVLFVSHQLGEVLEITDHVTVLRGGRVVADTPTAQTDQDQLIHWIVGRSMDELYPDRHESPPRSDVVVSARGLTAAHLGPLDLDLHAGEVVGLTGLVGSGFEQVPYLLYGASHATGGDVEVRGRPVPATRMRATHALEHGMVLVPGNRGKQSVAPAMTVLENVEGPVLPRFRRRGLINRGPLRRHVGELLRAYDVRPPEMDRPLATLSGGNQQKAVVGKWLQTDPEILLLHEPTQGVDIEARSEVFRFVSAAAARGAAVLLATSEFEDAAGVCDRVLVFQRGRIAAELVGPHVSAERIAEASYRPLDESGSA